MAEEAMVEEYVRERQVPKTMHVRLVVTDVETQREFYSTDQVIERGSEIFGLKVPSSPAALALVISRLLSSTTTTTTARYETRR